MKIRVEVTGLDEVADQLRRAGPAGIKVSTDVIDAWTTSLIPEVKAGTPRFEGPGGGDLEDSVRKTRTNVTKRNVVSGGVVAGGPRLASIPADRDPGWYAIQEHDDLTLKHTKGGPKFVERPFMRRAHEVPERILSGLDREIQK